MLNQKAVKKQVSFETQLHNDVQCLAYNNEIDD